MHRVTSRGIVWRLEDGNTELLIVDCAAESDDEVRLWRRLVEDQTPRVWGLSDVRELEDGRFRLVTPLRKGVLLKHWLGQSAQRGDDGAKSSIVAEAQSLALSLAASSPDGKAPELDRIIVEGDSSLWWAALPWLQLEDERPYLAEPQGGVSPGTEIEPVAGSDLPETTEIPIGRLTHTLRMLTPARKRQRLRVSSLAAVSILALTSVCGITWWRVEVTQAASCPSTARAQESLEALMEIRAQAIMDHDPERLEQVEQEPILSQDLALFTALRNDGGAIEGLTFDVPRVDSVSCQGESVIVETQVIQSEFRRCIDRRCESIPRRDSGVVEIQMDHQLKSIVDVRRLQ